MPGELDALIDGVKRKWAALGITPLAGATDSSIAAFEQRHGVRMPEDLRTWFRSFGGTELNEWDEELIRFWKLDEVQPAEVAPDFFVFADYSISAHEYAVHISESDTRVVMLAAPARRPVAPSFAAFLHVYLHDPERLFV